MSVIERWQLLRVDAGIKAADDNLFVEDAQIKQALKLCKNQQSAGPSRHLMIL